MDLARRLRELREERGVSRKQLADEIGIKPSQVGRVEAGQDARLSTWIKLYDGLGYLLTFDVMETCEEVGDLLSEEAEARRVRRTEGLCTGKRRW